MLMILCLVVTDESDNPSDVGTDDENDCLLKTPGNN